MYLFVEGRLSVRKLSSWIVRDENGQGLTEYALIMAFVSIALVAGLVGMRNALESTFQGASDTLVRIASSIKP